jgi:hypothetical protein
VPNLWRGKRSKHRVAGTLAVMVALGVNAEGQPLDVVYVPTPPAVVNVMLELAHAGPNDFLIDLGSGDGRIPITAAKRLGTRGLGVDIDPARIEEASTNAEAAGVADKVTFEQGDLFKTDLSRASVLTLYLSQSINARLRNRILSDLKPGSRVVSHAFDMGSWLPDRTERIEGRVAYFWVVPAKLAGKWLVREQGTDGERKITLQLAQEFQNVSGHAVNDGRSNPLGDVSLEGNRVSFDVVLEDGGTKRFEGRVFDGRIEGPGWQATRTSD